MSTFRFDTIEYKRPDFDALEKLYNGYTAKVRSAVSYSEGHDAIYAADEAMKEPETMFSVAHIRNTLNTTDKFYEDEMAFLHERFPVAQISLNEFSKALAESSFTKEIDEEFGPEFLMKIKKSNQIQILI